MPPQRAALLVALDALAFVALDCESPVASCSALPAHATPACDDIVLRAVAIAGVVWRHAGAVDLLTRHTTLLLTRVARCEVSNDQWQRHADHGFLATVRAPHAVAWWPREAILSDGAIMMVEHVAEALSASIVARLLAETAATTRLSHAARWRCVTSAAIAFTRHARARKIDQTIDYYEATTRRAWPRGLRA